MEDSPSLQRMVLGKPFPASGSKPDCSKTGLPLGKKCQWWSSYFYEDEICEMGSGTSSWSFWLETRGWAHCLFRQREIFKTRVGWGVSIYGLTYRAHYFWTCYYFVPPDILKDTSGIFTPLSIWLRLFIPETAKVDLTYIMSPSCVLASSVGFVYSPSQ